jgi:tripartite-type tricarboxylate transporter receptor subunit TctC
MPHRASRGSLARTAPKGQAGARNVRKRTMKISDLAAPAVSRRALMAFGALAATGAAAQTAGYPNRPIRIIVPYTPGGTTDIATRLVGEPLSKVLGQPVVVENRPGANSIVGVAAAATSPADGYTIVMVLPAHAANATLQAGKMPFDAITSFTPLSLVVTAPLVLAGSKHVPRRRCVTTSNTPGRIRAG